VDCDLCDRPAMLSTGYDIFPHRRDLYSKRFWTCDPCKTRVGCHPYTLRPLGTMADDETRNWRRQAHNAFDSIWKCTDVPRIQAYAWLAGALGIEQNDCHIGQMDTAQCKKVIRAVARRSHARATL